MEDGNKARATLSKVAFFIVATVLIVDIVVGLRRSRDDIVNRTDVLLIVLLMGAGGLAIKLSKDGLEVNPEVDREKAAEHLEKAEKRQSRDIGSAEAMNHVQKARLTKGARAIWVDDNPPNNIEETLMLESLGIHVTHTTTTESGLEYLRDVPFDLAITDLTRGTNPRAGLDFLAEASKVRATTKCLVYAGKKDERAAEAKALGAVAVTTAPLELLQAVVSTLS